MESIAFAPARGKVKDDETVEYSLGDNSRAERADWREHRMLHCTNTNYTVDQRFVSLSSRTRRVERCARDTVVGGLAALAAGQFIAETALNRP